MTSPHPAFRRPRSDRFRSSGALVSRLRLGDGQRVRRQPRRRSDRRARARSGSVRRDDRDAAKGAANSLSAETAAKSLEGRRDTLRARGASRRTRPRVVARRGDCPIEVSDSSACPVREAAERPSRCSGRELVVQEQRHLGVGDAGDRPERVAGAGGEGVGVRRR